jgi:hypothetical protein
MVLEGTLDFYLNQGTALRLIYEKAEPFLWATQYVRPVQDDKASFLYRYDAVGMDADPKKAKPAHVAIGGDFPEIDMSRPSVTTAMTESRGFMVRIKRQVIREEPQGISEVMRAYNFAGFWMARFINDAILTAITAGATTPSWTPTAVWSAATATPVDDLIRLEAAMERDGYPYRLTDCFVHKTNWYELKQYLTSVDIGDVKQRQFYGIPAITGDEIEVPVSGAVVHKCQTGMTEGYMLGLDRNNPCAELHYYVDSKFGTDTVSYDSVVNGARQRIKAANIGFHFEQLEDPNNHDTQLKFWVESKCVVTEAYAAQYDNGI